MTKQSSPHVASWRWRRNWIAALPRIKSGVARNDDFEIMRVLALLFGWLALAAFLPPPMVNDAAITGEGYPQTLREFGFFLDSAGQTPGPGVHPYELNTPLFSDYASKQRWVYVPAGQTATYSEDGVFDFPVGSALIKSFGYPADFRDPDGEIRLIETRVLLRREDGWVALPYVWNEDQTEATLRRAGRRMPVSFIDAQGETQEISYRVPNQNQCKSCHQLNGEIELIGPSARNLNNGARLANWVDWSILDRAPADAPALPVWDDPATGSLDERARAYLDVNCAHCHRRESGASNSGLFLSYQEPNTVVRGILKRPVAAGRGSGGHEFSIAPGHPERSILLHRMMSDDPGVQMPELGREILHAEGIALIREYIAAMPEAD